jgi:dihydroxy-acid dehydratase
MQKKTAQLRSQQWWSGGDYYSYARKSWLQSEGFSPDVFDGKPVIGICNSWSELNNCNAHLRSVAEAVKRGVWIAGGFPLEFPTISLGEMFMKPTSMMYRNLMAMDVEESIRANPLDAVVLLCGCDKTTPAQLMGAASADVPAIVVPGGPMISGQWKDKQLGAGTDGRKYFEMFRSGRITEEEWSEIQGGLARSPGHCTVMGTASTMTSLAEALGMTLPGAANIPAIDARRLVSAEMSGRRVVEMVWEDLRPSQIMKPEAFDNAITVDMAIGGSTNAVVHLIAIAGRLGIDLPLSKFDEISRRTPCLVNVKPSGEYLMEDFFQAGGVGTVIKEILPLLHQNALTVNGRTLAQNVMQAECYRREVIRSAADPLYPEGGTVILGGNLAPDGAVLKQTAASSHLLQHRGPAYVFENYEQMRAQIDRDDLPVTRDSVLVMKNGGPKGGPGFPEWGHIPMPKALLRQGINDMVRVSDARMSGTSFGTVVLHVAPESAIGGPLAAVQTGDEIELDVNKRSLSLCIPQSEIEARLARRTGSFPKYERGYAQLFIRSVLQANEGCDFDFLRRATHATG